MSVQTKKKILAIEMVLLLLVAGFVGYVYISRQSVSGENENTIQDTIKTTDAPSKSLHAHIKAGPLTGYGPLAVHFYGNPENDSNIVSYNWEFGPQGAPILSQSNYNKIVTRPIFKAVNLLFIGTFLLFGIIFLQMSRNIMNIRGNTRKFNILWQSDSILFITVIISSILYSHQARLNRQYTSTDRDPTMVFLATGSYSATLTVTDKQGNTSSDTVWITVLQYVIIPPDNDND